MRRITDERKGDPFGLGRLGSRRPTLECRDALHEIHRAHVAHHALCELGKVLQGVRRRKVEAVRERDEVFKVDCFDGRDMPYGLGELDALVPAYAVTIHKSQGSEYPTVVIPVLKWHYVMLQRNQLYTGISRGRRLVVLVGSRRAVAIAVRNVSGRRRWSKLRERLAE